MSFDDIWLPDFWPILMSMFILQIILLVVTFTMCLFKREFNYMNKIKWLLVIVFVHMIGPLLFLILERD
ncbi:PLDc N-terminal domain-containing protein [Aliicoccus persicus]|uniref:Phospholipase_D-nuclease N-terminal n=1 Tax=Aliicoccus persicus TaxID=930138 RepID=A0A662Z678_9STAP|nr:PLDc N-terminal domain-containing protein [Aliicoccus persicus]SEW07470.1 Phospholipase_D-nuclease N-terminal [Aliicoccus persicus]